MQKLHSFRIPSGSCSSVRRPWGCALPARALPQLIPPLVAAALVRLVSLRVVDTDRYDRTVAEILRKQQNVNLQMVRRGQAFAHRQYLLNCNATTYPGQPKQQKATAPEVAGIGEGDRMREGGGHGCIHRVAPLVHHGGTHRHRLPLLGRHDPVGGLHRLKALIALVQHIRGSGGGAGRG